MLRACGDHELTRLRAAGGGGCSTVGCSTVGCSLAQVPSDIV
jgi:hypothetical protein